jgi:hypothetical protein
MFLRRRVGSGRAKSCHHAGMTRPSPIPLRPDAGAMRADQRRSLHRLLAATALAELTNSSVDKIIDRAWPNDTLVRTAVNITGMSSAVALAPSVVGPALTGIAPASAASRLFEHERTIKLDFKGVAEYRIPRGSLTPQPIFIAEGAPMPMSQLALTSATIGPPRKILLGTAISNEVEFLSANTASSIIGTIIAEQAARSLDAAVFDAAAADATRPAGLLNGVTPITATPAGGQADHQMITDVANLAQAISNAGLSTAGMVLVAGASSAVKLKLLSGPLFDYEILETTGLPGTTAVAIAPAAIATGFSGTPEISMSKDAIAHFDDTTPLPIGSTGSPNTIAAVTRSAWQQNLLFLKVRLKGAWGVAQPGAIQVVNSVTW